MIGFSPASPADVLKLLPIRELIQRGYLPLLSRQPDQRVREAARFFGVSPGGLAGLRHSTAYKGDPYALAAWLRVGELEARQVVCRRYNREKFLSALSVVRRLTRQTPQVFLPQMVQQCAAAGVAVVIVPEFKGCRVSGASRWLSKGKALIQLSLRYRRDDQFFFSFFHEAGHLLAEDEGGPRRAQSSRRMKDEAIVCENPCRATDDDSEARANAFARDFLIPPENEQKLRELAADPNQKSKSENQKSRLLALVEELGIAPGILVGRLHHDGLLPWHELAKLKRPMDFSMLEPGREGMWATWLTVTQAAELLLRDLPKLEEDLAKARAVVSEAAGRGAFLTNSRKGVSRRIEPVSLAAWRLKMRDRDLDAEEREEAA